MTTLTERIPFDDITERAHAVPFWRTVFRLLTFIPFALGWLAAKVFAVAWFAVAWVWVSLCEGWESAHGPSRKQREAALQARVRELEVQLGRFGE